VARSIASCRRCHSDRVKRPQRSRQEATVIASGSLWSRRPAACFFSRCRATHLGNRLSIGDIGVFCFSVLGSFITIK
ncbi:MAG: hypothetical protein ACKN9U_00820, partial [Pirellulaceae bacterium]